MPSIEKLFHDLMNELQAVSGFIELAPKCTETTKAKTEMKSVFRLTRLLRRAVDGEVDKNAKQ